MMFPRILRGYTIGVFGLLIPYKDAQHSTRADHDEAKG
jgi:hypothetical protein